ncbi:MAG TPA: DUF1961 family protein [Pontiellaceae bacterium]|mgnify:CR=1 FL=1|nr:DUF1961 family protein [Pontiellaceae bacterium]HPR83522.1 DUF1961 family protein [Pontiellaceae bacterium]
MKLLMLFIIGAAAAGYCAEPPTPVYKCSFDTPDVLNDWVMEGPGVAEVKDGRLLIYSKWQPELEKIKDRVPLLDPGGDKYFPFIEQWVKEREPEMLPKYMSAATASGKKSGDFAGGHIQYWNKHSHPANFLIRIKFQAASPWPLHMMTFCARGLHGESIFDPGLAPRYGLAAQYMFGDFSNYRISYWSGTRGTCNMRRAPGRKLTATDSVDLPAYAMERPVQLEIIRWNGRVVFTCDGKKLVDWTDDEPLGDGFFSLRLMAAAKGWYDDYEVYELHQNPFPAGPAN